MVTSMENVHSHRDLRVAFLISSMKLMAVVAVLRYVLNVDGTLREKIEFLVVIVRRERLDYRGRHTPGVGTFFVFVN